MEPFFKCTFFSSSAKHGTSRLTRKIELFLLALLPSMQLLSISWCHLGREPDKKMPEYTWFLFYFSPKLPSLKAPFGEERLSAWIILSLEKGFWVQSRPPKWPCVQKGGRKIQNVHKERIIIASRGPTVVIRKQWEQWASWVWTLAKLMTTWMEWGWIDDLAQADHCWHRAWHLASE